MAIGDRKGAIVSKDCSLSISEEDTVTGERSQPKEDSLSLQLDCDLLWPLCLWLDGLGHLRDIFEVRTCLEANCSFCYNGVNSMTHSNILSERGESYDYCMAIISFSIIVLVN